MTSDLEKINNSFEQTMIDSEYKIWEDNFDSAIRIFQKKFVDMYGIRYYLTCKHYNLYKQGVTHDITNDDDKYDFSVQYRLNEKSKDQIVDIRFSGDVLPNKYRDITTLEEIETFFENMFLYLKAEHYELY